MIVNLEKDLGKTSNNSDGLKLFSLLKKAKESNVIIIIEIAHYLPLSSSFLNTSIGLYIENYGIDDFKKNIKIRSTKNQFDRILKYITNHDDILEN